MKAFLPLIILSTSSIGTKKNYECDVMVKPAA